LTLPIQVIYAIKTCEIRHKIWLLCDSKTKFAWNAQVYTGKTPGQPAEKNQGQRVVLDLVKYLKGRNITTHQLAVKLLAKKNTLVVLFD